MGLVMKEGMIEAKDCQDCKHHHCHGGERKQDCSCDLIALVSTCTHGIPEDCPLKPRVDESRLLTEKELREAIKNASGLYLHPDDEEDALDGIMSIIRAACWPKGGQELPEPEMFHTPQFKHGWEECQDVMKYKGWKACQEWEHE